MGCERAAGQPAARLGQGAPGHAQEHQGAAGAAAPPRAPRPAVPRVPLPSPPAGCCSPRPSRTLEELTGIDLDAVSRGEAPDWPRVDGPLFGVCTHGRHDACCAERGRPVAAALTASHPAETWEISHMGGDRFAANMVVLPEGLYYGRMDPGTASPGRLPCTRTGGSTWPGCAGGRRTPCTCSTPRSRCAATSRRTASTPYASSAGRDGPACSVARASEWAVTVRRTERRRSPAHLRRGEAQPPARARGRLHHGARSGLSVPRHGRADRGHPKAARTSSSVSP